jgi:hypothetical protein
MGRRPNKPQKDQHYEGEILDFYLNPRDEDPNKVLGVGELISLEKEADVKESYILEHEERHNISRSFEYWKMRFFTVTSLGKSRNYEPGKVYVMPVPIVYAVGRIVSGVKSLKHVAGQITYDVDYGFEDNFEGVPGWGQQF